MPDLISELVEAFPPRPLSPDMLGESTGMWDTYIRRKAFEPGCRGLSWNTLHPAFVEAHYDALRWMGLDSFAAFLPAYLASLLRGDTQNMLPSMVLSQLTREERFEDKFDARVAHLTAGQQAATLHVLESLAQGSRLYDRFGEDIDAAIASWRAVRDLPAPAASDVITASPPAPPAADEPARPTISRMPDTPDADPAMAALLDAIIQAFPPRPFPPDLFDDPSGMWEGYLRIKEIEAGIQGQSWDTLIPEFVEIHSWAICYMTPRAFAAFIPACLGWLVRGDTYEEEPVFMTLTRNDKRPEELAARVAMLTDEQRAVILRVLEALTHVEDLAGIRPRIDAALACWRTL